ncbi:MAG: DUF2851 family protein [Ignavibacteriaceae bacterium]|nr:DUF2851 family protein [Ignavibacteriaceae bacterium]MCW9066289.1 DUF2851 family protein [Ignavibacteriaceae bacterium]
MSIHEKIIYEIWKEVKFSKEIILDDSQKIEVIDPGNHNKELAGPDFLNARIKFGNITYLGDIEIDTWHSDWKTHGHYFDKKYNKVILHIVTSKEKMQPFVFCKDGRKIHSICILDFVDENFHSLLIEAVKSEKQNRSFDMPCRGRNESIHKNEKLEFLAELGIERLKKKSKRCLDRLKEIVYLKEMNIREPVLKYDFGEEFFNKKFATSEFSDIHIWEQLIYEMIFEALGYSRNKEIMMKMAKAVNISFLNNFRSDEKFELITECALFNVSGIIPQKIKYNLEETTDYLRQLIEVWNSIKDKYDGKMFKKEDWNFFRSRPQNFPTIRLSGGAHLISHILTTEVFKSLTNYFNTDRTVKEANVVLRNYIITEAKGYWTDHFNFDKKSPEKLNYFIGVSRADEIIVNVLFPILIVYFEIFDQNDSARRVKKLYLNYTQHGSNMVVEKVESTLGLDKASRRSANYQAMIELFRNYCVKERCPECKIGQKIFN